ncbi:MAG: hypothetical protein KGJ11_00250 [Candidatus Omnitrophica bacterium]|nr:hypothetical protein [Candidatus Omnitrophota bacterium]
MIIKPWYIGVADLMVCPKTKEVYLEGWFGRLWFKGIRNKKNNDTYDLFHIPRKQGKEQVVKEAEDGNGIPIGQLKLKIKKSTAIRIFTGGMNGIAVLGGEDRKVRNRFHFKVDVDLLNEKRSRDPNGDNKAEF